MPPGAWFFLAYGNRRRTPYPGSETAFSRGFPIRLTRSACSFRVCSRACSSAQQEQVEALRSALHVSDLRYKGGITSYVDVLLAKRNLFNAEFALTATHRFHLVSVVQLYKALGGGWFAG